MGHETSRKTAGTFHSGETGKPIQAPPTFSISPCPPEPQVVRHTTQPSIEFTRNAKGDISYSIKASGESLSQLLDEVWSIDGAIMRRESARQETEKKERPNG